MILPLPLPPLRLGDVSVVSRDWPISPVTVVLPLAPSSVGSALLQLVNFRRKLRI